jgi:hypothetical protein
VAAFEIVLRRLLELGERRLREIEKRLVVLPERVGRERRERLAQLRLGVLQQRELFSGRLPLPGQLGFEARARRCELGCELRACTRHPGVAVCAHDEPNRNWEENHEHREGQYEEGHVTRSLGETL